MYPMQGGQDASDHTPLPRDLPKSLWLWLPLLLFLGWLGLFLAHVMHGGYEAYEFIFQLKEGPIEYANVLLMFPGIAACLWCAGQCRAFPSRWLAAWMLLWACGLIFIAGEELSWGHHILVQTGLKEPAEVIETKLGVNEQGETNIHNLDNPLGKFLGRIAKLILEFSAYFFCVMLPIIGAVLKNRLSTRGVLYWLLPTYATTVAAAATFLVYRPMRFYFAATNDGDTPSWLRTSEVQEFFLGLTLVLYVLSILWRLKSIRDTERGSAASEFAA